MTLRPPDAPTAALAPAAALRRLWGGDSPELAIERAVDTLLQIGEVSGPPAPLELLASLRGVANIQFTKMIEAGRLVFLPGSGWRIQVNAAHPSGRQRFTIAHEICHTFFHEAITAAGAADTRERRRSDPLTGDFDRSGDQEEWLCDYGAARLILHPNWLTALAADRAPSLDALADIAAICDSSHEATAVQIARLRLWPCVFVYWGFEGRDADSLAPYRVYPALDDDEIVLPTAARGSSIRAAMNGGSRRQSIEAGWSVESWYAGYRTPQGKRVDRILSLLQRP